jgi:hypothetical protein
MTIFHRWPWVLGSPASPPSANTATPRSAFADTSSTGLPDLRGGDLVARFGADVDAADDVLVRVVLPYAVAALVITGSAALTAALLPPAGVVLLVAAVAVVAGAPAITHLAAARAARRTAPARGELAAGIMDLLHGLPDLVAHGAADRALARLAETDARLHRPPTAPPAPPGWAPPSSPLPAAPVSGPGSRWALARCAPDTSTEYGSPCSSSPRWPCSRRCPGYPRRPPISVLPEPPWPGSSRCWTGPIR